MYEAPIELIKMQNDMMMDIHRKLAEEQETYIMQSVEKVGVNVNREELIKALAYDREQYVKGYADGMKEFAEQLQDMLGDPFLATHNDLCVVIDKILAEVTPNFAKVDHSSLCETETYKG